MNQTAPLMSQVVQRQGPTCRNCRLQGHYTLKCPKTARMTCYKCFQVGHPSASVLPDISGNRVSVSVVDNISPANETDQNPIPNEPDLSTISQELNNIKNLNGIKFLHINCRSFYPKIEEIRILSRSAILIVYH